MTIRLAPLAVVISLVLWAEGASPQDQTALLKQSSIVFTGTVAKLGVSSFAEVPASSKTIVVHVDSVLKKPPAVSLKNGDDVTVETKESSDVKKGLRATFYTDVLILGSGVAVREIGHVPLSAAQTVTEGFSLVQKQLSDQELEDRLNAANVVVTGHVLTIKPSTVQVLNAGGSPPISEHMQPDWKEAVVVVDSAIKGTDSKQVVVRFPASKDVRWVTSPKLKVGQTGTFILKSDEVSGSPKALFSGTEVTAYTALDSTDVLSAGEAARVRALLKK